MRKNIFSKVIFILSAVLVIVGHVGAAVITNGLVLHVNAGAIGQAGGQVTNLVDQSAREIDFEVNKTSGDTFGAIVNLGALNSHDTLTITNRGFRMGPSDAADLNATSNGLTVFLVASVPHDATKRILRKQGGSVNDPGYNLLMYSDKVEAWASQDSGNRRAQSYSTVSSDFFVLAMVIDVSNSTLSTYYNGDSFTTSVNSGTLSPLVNSLDFDMGDGLVGMKFAELAVYNRALAIEEWNEVGATLGEKYGLSTSYAPPPDIVSDGLVLYVNADAVGQANGQVTNLVDQSARRIDFGANKTSGDVFGAIVNTGGLNSYDTLTITNRGFRMSPSDAADLNVTSTGLTVFLVASVPHDSTKRILKKQGGSVNDPGYNLLMYSDKVEAWASQDSGNRRAQSYSTVSSDFFVLAMVVDLQSSTLSTYYNGTSFTTSVNAGTLSLLANSLDFDMGDGLDNMEFAALAVYNRALSEEEWNGVGYTLSQKYGIDTSYEAAFPLDPQFRIVLFEPFATDVFKLVIGSNIPYPSNHAVSACGDLSGCAWEQVAISTNGLPPFLLTNLQDCPHEGTNYTVYVESTNSMTVFRAEYDGQ